ncbi:spore photoproduct lyase family protein, partial [Candidatus Hydrogenedentota bacterium]
MSDNQQLDLFGSNTESVALPTDYSRFQPYHFHVERIILTKGSVSTPEQEVFVRRICDAYPDVSVEEMLDIPHNRVELGEEDPVKLHEMGRRTLVFGELKPKSAVRYAEVNDRERPRRWHFSVYGYCPYRCRYCYLSGNDGVWHSPTVKIYVNLPEILCEIGRQANSLDEPTVFTLGKLQDGLALDPLTAYSTMLVPFFAKSRHARLLIQTKSASVERLLDLKHNGNTVLSWSLNP